jgi:phosphatidylethanolamine-binding protein (PEBP) family uncharacterized protein
MNVIYSQTHRVFQGKFMTPRQTARLPRVSFAHRPRTWYTLALVDPDARGGLKIHWLVETIPGDDVSHGTTIVPYQGPKPPKNTGIHHYIFLVWEQGSKNIATSTYFTSAHIERSQ